MAALDFDQVVSRLNTYCAKWRGAEHNPALISLSVADMDFPSLPVLTQELARLNTIGIYGYTELSDDWQPIVSDWFDRHYQWQVPHEHIVFCPRIIQAIALYLQNFTTKADQVLILAPSYQPITDIISHNQLQLLVSELIEQQGYYQIDFADLEHKFAQASLFILISPHNPTGRVWQRWELEKIAQLAEQYEVTVIADEIHADFIFNQQPHYPFSEISEYAKQNSLICTSPAKTFNLAGLEIANIVIANPLLREKFKQSLFAAGIHNPGYFSVAAQRIAYLDGDEWLNQLRHYIQQNRAYVKQQVELLLPGIVATQSEGTYLLWFDYRSLGLTESQLKYWFNELANVSVSWGTGFGIGGEGFFRVNLATPKTLLQQALQRLHQTYPY